MIAEGVTKRLQKEIADFDGWGIPEGSQQCQGASSYRYQWNVGTCGARVRPPAEPILARLEIGSEYVRLKKEKEERKTFGSQEA